MLIARPPHYGSAVKFSASARVEPGDVLLLTSLSDMREWVHLQRCYPLATVVAAYSDPRLALGMGLQSKGCCVISIVDDAPLMPQLRGALCDSTTASERVVAWVSAVRGIRRARLWWVREALEMALLPSSRTKIQGPRRATAVGLTARAWRRVGVGLRSVLAVQRSPRTPVAHVAEQLGLHDGASLSRQIYSAFGHRPTEVRQRLGFAWLLSPVLGVPHNSAGE